MFLYCVTLLLLVGPWDTLGRNIPAFAGPFIVSVSKFYMCDGDYHWTLHLKTTHLNPAKPFELQRISGWVNATVGTFIDTGWLLVIMDVRSNNMWKENAFTFSFPKNGCSMLRTHIPDFYNVMFHGNKTGTCMVPPNLYEVHDEPIAWIFPKIPVMPYGTYRFKLSAGVAERKYPEACFVAEIQIFPKPA